MNLTEMYLNSPDWLKLIWIISPYLTLYALGRIWAKHWVKPVPKAEVEELQWVEVDRDTEEKESSSYNQKLMSPDID